MTSPFEGVRVPKRLPPKQMLLSGDPAVIRDYVVNHAYKEWQRAKAATIDGSVVFEIQPNYLLRELGVTLEINRRCGYAPISAVISTLKWLGMSKAKGPKNPVNNKRIYVFRLEAEPVNPLPCGSNGSTEPTTHKTVDAAPRLSRAHPVARGEPHALKGSTVQAEEWWLAM